MSSDIYTLKFWSEMARSIGIALITYIVQILASGVPADNWKAWGVGVIIGAAHIVGVTLLAALPNNHTTPRIDGA